MIAAVGGLRFRLYAVRYRRLPAFDDCAGILVVDGAPVRAACLDGRLVWVVDHRRDADGLARAEVWRAEACAEGAVPNLVVLSDAAPPGGSGAETCSWQ
jgi:hypothetical protein